MSLWFQVVAGELWRGSFYEYRVLATVPTAPLAYIIAWLYPRLFRLGFPTVRVQKR